VALQLISFCQAQKVLNELFNFRVILIKPVLLLFGLIAEGVLALRMVDLSMLQSVLHLEQSAGVVICWHHPDF
jgi:hypothetical protein